LRPPSQPLRRDLMLDQLEFIVRLTGLKVFART
jgi:hypothetical protein